MSPDMTVVSFRSGFWQQLLHNNVKLEIGVIQSFSTFAKTNISYSPDKKY